MDATQSLSPLRPGDKSLVPQRRAPGSARSGRHIRRCLRVHLRRFRSRFAVCAGNVALAIRPVGNQDCGRQQAAKVNSFPFLAVVSIACGMGEAVRPVELEKGRATNRYRLIAVRTINWPCQRNRPQAPAWAIQAAPALAGLSADRTAHGWTAILQWIGQHEAVTRRHMRTASAAVLICLSGKGYTYTAGKIGHPPLGKGYDGEDPRPQDYEPVGGSARRR